MENTQNQPESRPLAHSAPPGALMRVVGVGGAGGNAVNRMIDEGLTGVEFITVNTDHQALDRSKAAVRVQIGETITRGLGVGGRPDVGAKAVEENLEQVLKEIEGSDLVFITAGMGGGTGTGAAPIIARHAKELGILTIAIVTTPFSFEGKVRSTYAENGVAALTAEADTVIVVSNDRLREICPPATPFREALKVADEVLLNATRGISGIISRTGEINTDFADVRTIMAKGGSAILGRGDATGEDAASQAARKAVDSPLLNDVSLKGATRLLVNIRGSDMIDIDSVERAADLIRNEAHPEAEIIFGMEFDPSLQNTVEVTVIATGFDDSFSLFQNKEGSSPNTIVETDVRLQAIDMFQADDEHLQGVRKQVEPARTGETDAGEAPRGGLIKGLFRKGMDAVRKRPAHAQTDEEGGVLPALSDLPPMPSDVPDYLRIDEEIE